MRRFYRHPVVALLAETGICTRAFKLSLNYPIT
jgi:hypothetical protein